VRCRRRPRRWRVRAGHVNQVALAEPESWAKKAYPNLIHYNKLNKGGHFAAWEQPELSASEVRAGFRSLR
jgi:pimeloyl-ACP methyl ester carboxylesterase